MHLNSEDHKKAVSKALIQNSEKVKQLRLASALWERALANQLEDLKRQGIEFSAQHRGMCIMCGVQVNNLGVHKKSARHLALKNQIYSQCDRCGMRFKSKKLELDHHEEQHVREVLF